MGRMGGGEERSGREGRDERRGREEGGRVHAMLRKERSHRYNVSVMLNDVEFVVHLRRLTLPVV